MQCRLYLKKISLLLSNRLDHPQIKLLTVWLYAMLWFGSTVLVLIRKILNWILAAYLSFWLIVKSCCCFCNKCLFLICLLTRTENNCVHNGESKMNCVSPYKNCGYCAQDAKVEQILLHWHWNGLLMMANSWVNLAAGLHSLWNKWAFDINKWVARAFQLGFTNVEMNWW